VDWSAAYRAVRESVGITSPGYMIHEAVVWSPVRQEQLIYFKNKTVPK
jgi:hypothetical protein